jgi:5'-3' exonuclease
MPADTSSAGVGRQRAYSLIQKHGSIEEILKHIDTSKMIVPEDWKYKEARELFKNPEVSPASDFDVRSQSAFFCCGRALSVLSSDSNVYPALPPLS